ncbi:MAG: MMPL family transporter, partial [Clostridia bacterium]|nr:MMPL family transporter [Clostridia bacterium]
IGGAKITAGKETSVEKGFGTMNTLVIVLPSDGDSEKQHKVIDYVTSFEVIDSTTMKIADGVYLTDAFTKEEAQEKIPALMSSFGGAESDFTENLAKSYVGSVYNGYCETYDLPETAKVPLIDLLIFISQNDTYGAFIPRDFKDGLSQLPYAKANLFGEHYVRMTFNINASVEDEKAFNLIAALKTGLKDYYEEFYMTGETVVCYDMSEYFPQDNRNIALFTLAFILLILFITFKNLLLPLLLALAIQGGIWINFIIPFLVGYPLCFIGYLIITAIQMGATIDYAIVLTNRYYTIRNRYEDRLEAMAVALNAVFPTIMTSGVILTVTGFTLAVASSGVVSAMGSLLGAGAALSVGIVLLILPSFLLVTEKATDLCDFSVLFKKLLSRRKK